jgi:hypothetical protein
LKCVALVVDMKIRESWKADYPMRVVPCEDDGHARIATIGLRPTNKKKPSFSKSKNAMVVLSLITVKKL